MERALATAGTSPGDRTHNLVAAFGYDLPFDRSLSSRAAKLVVARLDEKGALAPVETIATAPSARNPVVTEKGVAYLTDAHDGSILVVEPPR